MDFHGSCRRSITSWAVSKNPGQVFVVHTVLPNAFIAPYTALAVMAAAADKPQRHATDAAHQFAHHMAIA